MKPFAIYFPQFYPTPTNDQAWGHGFTDWSLVANANLRKQWVRRAPLRGFYDGSSPNVHRAQIDEMKRFDLGGFAVYHYWFFTHQELGAFESTILDQAPGLPWFMIWATESWSKRWLGDSTQIVRLSEMPTDAEIDEHCDYLARCFGSPDYMQVDGRPLFIVYNLSHFTNPGQVLSRYRDSLRQRGYEVCLGHFVKNPFDVGYSSLVDVTYLFEPRLFFGMQRTGRGSTAKRIHDWFKSILGETAVSKIMLMMDRVQQRGTIFDASMFLSYLRSNERAAVLRNVQGPVQDVLSAGWNNTPRYSERFTSLESIDAPTFGRLVREASLRCELLPPLVNAWNEWSEGAAIEPCAYFGTRYLDSMSC
jgi:Glycosyltransferase WbsX